ncbi:Beauvericin cluster-specific repressor BEA4 [Fusarium oxysporum f. sp. rapae]|uniref:Beauvericin cluster-specific repressor BEA4 n=1 Tax=Fusarium oxysporum f. sp. rapae TaxID=485398 RepID=A0A8J5NLC8_FUSOX|nr:Beauvericin cluster-specific repressor BEA4 [Fusarium oxysporum f. sp. rapae]
MVGIAGKSKACHDCRRRRVKCDLTLPLCRRCIKPGIACRGYERLTLWVHRTPACPNVTALSTIGDLRLKERTRETPTSSEWLGLLRRMYTRLNSDDLLYPMQRPSDALDHRLLAFGAIQIHLSGEIGISYNEAVQLYNDALSRVISTLNSPFVVYSDESLAAIIILTTCEVFLSHASMSWNAHAQDYSSNVSKTSSYP